MQSLTAKQQKFVAEYLVDLNATQAAIRSGYRQKTAQEQSSRLLSKRLKRSGKNVPNDSRPGASTSG